ncbi:MAG: leucine-rich repeat domain-containing protein [Myxococcales bacterium]|nr:leucine-rich repeat domain-containing protein [Myxococcales bacterium]
MPTTQMARPTPFRLLQPERCATPDERVNLESLPAALAGALLGEIGVADGGMENPGFVRRTVTCAELATVKGLSLPVVPSIADLPPLPGLQSFHAINVVDGDLHVLESAAELRSVSIGAPSWSNARHPGQAPYDLTALESLVNLESLRVAKATVTEMRSLSSLVHLRSLELSGCGISDLSPLVGLSKLEELVLKDNTITDLAPLQSLVELRVLEISNNPVESLRPLTTTNMERLTAAGTNIKDLALLEHMPRLQSAWLCHTPLMTDPKLRRSARPAAKRLRSKNVSLTFDVHPCTCC